MWSDFRRGLERIKEWDRADWMRLAPVLALLGFFLIWFLTTNLYAIKHLDERPLYKKSPNSKLIAPVEPFLVTEDDANTESSSFISDSDYRYFDKTLKSLGATLAKREAVAGDDTINQALDNVTLTLPEGAAAGHVSEASLSDIQGDSARGNITAVYTVGEDEVPISWDVVFVREVSGSWKLDSINQQNSGTDTSADTSGDSSSDTNTNTTSDEGI